MTAFRKAAEDYIEMRRALGWKLHAARYYLADFASFMEQRDAQVITSRLALEWAQQPVKVQPVTWANRLMVVREFAKYYRTIDARTEIPAASLLPHRHKRKRPYIFADSEIEALLEKARNLANASTFKRQTYYCLFGLLCVSGMRISEVLNLKVDDVDLETGVLTVQRSKFGKTRLIPLHDSTLTVLASYSRARYEVLKDRQSGYFFVSETRDRLYHDTVRRMFYALMKEIGSPRQIKKAGPRLHDLRHRFAIETLLHWHRDKQDIERGLPVLSTYLGHLNIAHTYWYLTACPELMGFAVQRLESFWEVDQ